MIALTSLGGDVVHSSVFKGTDGEFGLVRQAQGARLVVFASGPAPWLSEFEGDASTWQGRTSLVCPLSARNAAALRSRCSWLRPRPLGLRTSAGFGDRIGRATPGHLRAVRATGCRIAPVVAQQSMREMVRTGRSAQTVVDEAMWGVFQEGWRDGYGADADHLKSTLDIDTCLAAGFTCYTIDPGDHVQSGADTASGPALREAFDRLPWDRLEDCGTALLRRYVGRVFEVEDETIRFDEVSLGRAAVKYGAAVAHVVAMFRHLVQKAGVGAFELEVSVDETDTPTTHAEHYYVASELKRLGVSWVGLAPRYVGRFEKGVDYIGDLAAFDHDIAVHAAIARTLGPYKLSLHSGSDKFKIYPIVARRCGGYVHLKTAGTSYLEALRTIAALDPELFREVYAFARDHYDADRATYHVSARLDRAPIGDAVPAADLPALVDQFDARQIFHVTFGSVLTAITADGARRFYDRFMAAIDRNPEVYSRYLEVHFRRHLDPFVAGALTT
ncbi:MAG TPA: tagaturonate epimerase family protein [Vicinamibacterales bacterium]|jgi:hypothetical protein